jgi:hypothetical protein
LVCRLRQAVEEDFQYGIVLFGDHGAHEQSSANGCASAPDEAFAPPFAGLARERRQPDERCDLPVAELPELGQLGHTRARETRPTLAMEVSNSSLARQAGNLSRYHRYPYPGSPVPFREL